MDGSIPHGSLRASPNVTPLVDVVLVLLILFIVLMPAVNAKVQLPTSTQARASKENPPSLALAPDGTGALLTWGPRGRAPHSARLDDPQALARLMVAVGPPLERAGGRILLQADGRLPFGLVDRALSACRDAGTLEALVATR